MFVHKIIGSMAENGHSLVSCVEAAKKLSTQIFSMGLGLTGCTIPEIGKPAFVLNPDEVEIGLGIHGEKGKERIKLENSDYHMVKNPLLFFFLIKTFLQKQLVDSVLTHGKFTEGSNVALMLNNLGGLTAIELFVAVRFVLNYLGFFFLFFFYIVF